MPAGATAIRSPDIGRITHVDLDELADAARVLSARIEIVAMPGMFADGVRPLAWTAAPIDGDGQRRLADTFTIERHRAFDQDPRFGLVVLAEVASRALSPAVNDPGTAIAVIEAGMRVVSAMLRQVPAPDNAPPPEIAVPPLAFADAVEDLFRPIARDGAGTIEVGMRLQKALAAIASIDREAAPACAAEAADALERARAALASPSDKRTLEALHRALWATGDD